MTSAIPSGRTMETTIPVALRAWTEAVTRPKKSRSGGWKPSNRKRSTVETGPLVGTALVVDTETTVDAVQKLTFGSWRLVDLHEDGTMTSLQEGIFHADRLAKTDPEGFRILRTYAETRSADVDGVPEAQPVITYQSRQEFIYSVFFPLTFKARRPVVMFNKPFDLSRLAVDFSGTRATRRADGQLSNDYQGGFSFQLGEDDRVIFEPRVRVKHIDPRKAFASFTRPKDDEYVAPGESNPGTFLDLRTWVFALTGEPHTLASACRRFKVEHGKLETLDDETAAPVEHGTITERYIDYNRRDVLATAELLAAVNLEHAAHPILSEPTRDRGGLAPGQAYSPASVAKAYLRGMGVTSPRDRFTVDPELAATLTGTSTAAFTASPEPQDEGTLGPVLGSYDEALTASSDVQDGGTLGPVLTSFDAALKASPVVADPAEHVKASVLGIAMSTFYGGRSECRIRHTPVPVQVLDFTSMYPTVNALMGVWGMLTAETVKSYDDTNHVQTLVNTITLDDLFDPKTWPELVGLCQIIPDGDVLPVRADYSDQGSYTIGLNPVHTDRPIWYTITDVIASVIITGRRPTILQAIRYRTGSHKAGMRPINLRGSIPVNPEEDEFFTLVIAERARVRNTDPDTAGFLKVLANSGSYGIFAQVDPDDRNGRQPITVHDHTGKPRTVTIDNPERPGEYAFPPIASAITGAARLMLAMLEVSVTREGGCWAFCDTDSLAVVATPDGGPVPCLTAEELTRTTPHEPHTTHTEDGRTAVHALSYHQVKVIRDRFHQLNPYGTAVAELLKNETNPGEDGGYIPAGTVPYCYAISAKRYACYLVNQDGNPVAANGPELASLPVGLISKMGSGDQIALIPGKWKEHGLGHLLGPSSEKGWGFVNSDKTATSKLPRQWWIADFWRTVIANHDPENLRGMKNPEWPDWSDAPAYHRVAVSSPDILHPFRNWNEGKAYEDQIKPFNFMMGVSAAFDWALNGAAKVTPVSPYTSNPQPEDMWFDKITGRPITITTDQYHSGRDPETGEEYNDGSILVQTYADVMNSTFLHPEYKFLGPDGKDCWGPGLLQRRPTHIALISTIGKETQKMDTIAASRLALRADDYIANLTPNEELDRPLREALVNLGTTEIMRLLETYSTDRIAMARLENRNVRLNIAAAKRKAAKDGTDPTEMISALTAKLKPIPSPVTTSERTIRRILKGSHPRGELRLALSIVSSNINPEHLCGCGCGETVGKRKTYLNHSHQMKAHRLRTREKMR